MATYRRIHLVGEISHYTKNCFTRYNRGIFWMQLMLGKEWPIMRKYFIFANSDWILMVIVNMRVFRKLIMWLSIPGQRISDCRTLCALQYRFIEHHFELEVVTGLIVNFLNEHTPARRIMMECICLTFQILPQSCRQNRVITNEKLDRIIR